MGKFNLPIMGKKDLARRHPTKWWITENIPRSPTEKRIARVLTELEIKYYQEVSFAALYHGNRYYRFDFWIPKYHLLIEYDGEHHKEQRVRINDEIKNRFCKDRGLRLFRIDKTHYNTLESRVKEIIERVKKRTDFNNSFRK